MFWFGNRTFLTASSPITLSNLIMLSSLLHQMSCGSPNSTYLSTIPQKPAMALLCVVHATFKRQSSQYSGCSLDPSEGCFNPLKSFNLCHGLGNVLLEATRLWFFYRLRYTLLHSKYRVDQETDNMASALGPVWSLLAARWDHRNNLSTVDTWLLRRCF